MAGFFASLGAFLPGREVYSEGRKVLFLRKEPSLVDRTGISVRRTDVTGAQYGTHGAYWACTHREVHLLGIQGGTLPGYTGRHTYQGVPQGVPLTPGYTTGCTSHTWIYGRVHHTHGYTAGCTIPTGIRQVHLSYPGGIYSRVHLQRSLSASLRRRENLCAESLSDSLRREGETSAQRALLP